MNEKSKLPRLNTRDGLPKAISLDQYLDCLDEDHDASKKAKVIGLIAYREQLCLLWTHKALARALPLTRVDENAKAQLAKLVSPDDMKLIDDYMKRDERSEFDAIKDQLERSLVTAF